MGRLLLIVTLLLLPTLSNSAGHESSKLPEDVASFVEKRVLCDHFRGEDPYDEERRKFLYKNIAELCTGSDQELANLKAKYKQNPAVFEKLSIYEEDIEPDNL